MVIVIGGLLGSGVDRLPFGSLTRCVLASVLTWNMSVLVVTLGWLFVSPFVGGARIFPLALREVLITSLIAAVVAGLFHFAVSSQSIGVDSDLVRYRTAVAGMLGALGGVVQGYITRATEEYE